MSLRFGPLFDSHRVAGFARSQPSPLRWPLVMLLGFVLMLPGCSGCTEDPNKPSDPKAAEKKNAKTAEKPKPDFEPLKLRIVPQQEELGLRPVKPGHWSAAIEAAKANNFDFIGDLRAELWESGVSTGADLERTPHRLVVRRPAPLAKGQSKLLEFDFFVPGDRERASLQSELVTRSGGTATSPGPEPLTLMRPYQYKLVVLAAEPDRYRPLERLDSIRMPQQSTPLYHYQIIAMPVKPTAPLPTNPMAWTSIAYLIWDDIDPQSLTAEQQRALLDWLHWGGQIIISGPKSLDRLRGSFLAPYLPATAGGAMEIDAERLEPLSRRWTLAEEGRPGPALAPRRPWSGVELTPVAGAEFLPDTSKLVVERQVGRGRIVVTAFRLTERDLWDWHSFDNFFNGCLLRRPPRKYEVSPEVGLNLNWADTAHSVYDPHLVSQVRLLSRDWNDKTAFAPKNVVRPEVSEEEPSTTQPDPNLPGLQSSESITFPADVTGPGVAGWTDFSDVGNASRFVLREGAGIVIPNADFVIWVLVIYLIVLVPLNWLVFWGLGRVEWAWIAAPIIALGGMVAVAKVAQLDIGFARSQTEVAVIETFAGYPRGHLTRYTALYTSLSSTYDARSPENNTLILPFSTEPNFTPLPGQSFDTVTFHTGPETRLSDFGVSSNSTSMLHSEQALDLGGAIDYKPHGGQADIVNHTKFDLKQAAILRRTSDGKNEIGWIGELPAGRGTNVTFLLPNAFAARVPRWSYKLGENAGDATAIDLSPLADLVRNFDTIRPGESRLVALIDHVLPGLDLEPQASQSPRGGTLLVAHLQPPPLAPPTPDFNSRRDFPHIVEEEIPDNDE